MKKKVLCFLLSAILIAGILPFGIFADDTITEIAVSGYKAPTIGMTAGEAAADTALPEGAQYYVNSERWWNETDGGSIGPEDVFEIGKIYSYGWTLYAEDGFTFDEDATVTINGGEVAIDWEYTYRSDEDDTVFYVWTLPAEAGLPENAILVDGFTAPYAGQNPADNLAGISLAEGLPYEIESLYWVYFDDGEHIVGEEETFSSEHTYFLTFFVVRADETAFGEELPAIYINGGTELVNSAYTAYNDDRTTVAFFSVGITPLIPITEVKIEGLVEPQVGLTAGECLASVKVPDDAPYAISDLFFVNMNTWDVMADGDKFIMGLTYYGIFALVPDDGYAFLDMPEITINGGAVQADYSNSGFEDGVLYALTADYEFPYPDDWIKIDKIEVTGYTAPKIGQSAGANLAGLSAADDAPYLIDAVIWRGYDDYDDWSLEDGDVFESGNTYYLFVALTAKDGYYFDLNASVSTVLINGSTDLWDDYYGAGVMNDGRCRFFTVDVTADGGAETDVTVGVYGNGMENWTGSPNKGDKDAVTQILFCPDPWDAAAYAPGMQVTVRMQAVDGSSDDTFTTTVATQYNGGSWGICRIEPCLMETPWIPAANQHYYATFTFVAANGETVTVTATDDNGMPFEYFLDRSPVVLGESDTDTDTDDDTDTDTDTDADTDVALHPYANGMENWTGSPNKGDKDAVTQILICVDPWDGSYYVPGLEMTITMKAVDGSSETTFTTQVATVYDGGDWGICRFEPCLMDTPWIPVKDQHYYVTATFVAADGNTVTLQVTDWDDESVLAEYFLDVDPIVVETPVLYGDVNNDGTVNKKDSLRLKQYLADPTTSIDLAAADVNNDGVVNKTDSLRLKQWLAGFDVVLGPDDPEPAVG